MKFSLWKQYGALNSQPVFDAFAHSLMAAGHTVLWNTPGGDVDVIWSVLWHGRMAQNKAIWDRAVAQSKPVVVLEVGGIQRGTTWKVGLNGINRAGYFGEQNNDGSRAASLGLVCKPWRSDGNFILICGQHDKSLQWQSMPRMSQWVMNTIEQIQRHSKRPIIFRPHPRCRLDAIEHQYKNVYRQDPRQLPGTYDDFDMKFDNIWATVSWSSNPGIHSVINGIPTFTGPESLAYTVANNDYAFIESPLQPERQQWLNDYAWTEYTVDEIANGLPLKRLTSKLF